MLNTVENSRAKKTAGIAVTYRAAGGAMYGTCPDSCPLKPVQTKTRKRIMSAQSEMFWISSTLFSLFYCDHYP